MRCFGVELKWKRGEKNWKGKRKITQVIRQTGEGSDKRIRGGERNWKLRRDIDRGQKHQEKYAVKQTYLMCLQYLPHTGGVSSASMLQKLLFFISALILTD